MTTTSMPDVSARKPPSLATLLAGARLRVLRATVLICLLISLGNFVGALAAFTPSGHVNRAAPLLGAAWCGVWALSAAFPTATARVFARWQLTAVVLVIANTLTVAGTGGIDSPLLAVCMYVGWIASVVVRPYAAFVLSVAVTGSVLAGYLLAGNSPADILLGPYRYGAVTNAALPILTGMVGMLVASVTNGTFNRMAATLGAMREGMPATTPGLTALLAGQPVLGLHAGLSGADPPARDRGPLTDAEREVVRLLADGYAPKQIAFMRGVALATVRSQLKRAKYKTGARTLAELARYSEATE